ADAPVYPRPARFGARPEHPWQPPRADPGHDAIAHAVASGMRLPRALRARRGCVPCRAGLEIAHGRPGAALRESPAMSPRPSGEGGNLLELRGISKRFDPGVQALDGVDLEVRSREVVGLVGESGCGKSTLGRVASRILDPTSGERLWKGRAYREYEGAGARRERLAVQMIFQDPYASLNPRMRVVDIVGEAPVVHGL